MNLKKAVKLADSFPEWVGDLLGDSAKGANQTIKWFIKTLYAAGYRIKKKWR